MTAGATAVNAQGGDAPSLVRSFGIASLVVLLGVTAAWLVVKRSGEAPVVADDDMFVISSLERRRGGGASMLLDQAEMAYAAGRIVEPEFDSALYFYQAVLAEDPRHREARLGLDRVVEWLRSELAAAQRETDTAMAVAVAAQIAQLRPADEGAAAQWARLSDLYDLEQRAERALDARRYQAAGTAYLEMRELDPDSVVAAAGLERARSGLVTQVRAAVNRGDLESARNGLGQLAGFGIDSGTRNSLEEIIAEAMDRRGDRMLESRLAAATRALEAGRLLAPESDSAWVLFNAVLEEHPDHAGARAGLVEVGNALLERARDAITGGRFDAVPALIAQAESADVPEADIRALNRELEYHRYLADMRAGRYGEALQVSDLRILAQRTPSYPRGAVNRRLEGWVDVEFTVSTTGEVEDVLVSDSSAAVFHEASIEAIRGYRFEPHRMHGRPVPVRAALRFNYRL